MIPVRKLPERKPQEPVKTATPDDVRLLGEKFDQIIEPLRMQIRRQSELIAMLTEKKSERLIAYDVHDIERDKNGFASRIQIKPYLIN